MPKAAATTFVNACNWECYVAPTGTAFPDADEPIATPWISIGIVKDDPTLELDISQESIRASNSCSVVRKKITDREFSWSIAQAQITKATVEHWAGIGTWSASGAGEIWTPDAGLLIAEKAILFQLIDGPQELRVGHPKVAITADGGIDWVTDDLVTLPVTATALTPDDDSSEIAVFANPPLLVA